MNAKYATDAAEQQAHARNKLEFVAKKRSEARKEDTIEAPIVPTTIMEMSTLEPKCRNYMMEVLGQEEVDSMARQQINKMIMKGVDFKALEQESQEILIKYLHGESWTKLSQEYESVPTGKEAEISLVQYDATKPPGPLHSR